MSKRIRDARWCEPLNAWYAAATADRSLLPAAEAAAWLGGAVLAFLRHGERDCFCLARDGRIAMADWVVLGDVQFLVDAASRAESLAGAGPLIDGRSVHAVLAGRLIACAASPRRSPLPGWQPVVYHPLHHDSFRLLLDERPVHSAARAVLRPGRHKVWIR